MNIDEHIGLSTTSIDRIKEKLNNLITKYEKIYEEEVINSGREIYSILAGDETFFQEMMLLVMIDLPSGFILLEEEAEDRTYETWREKAKRVLDRFNIKVKAFASDRARALIKLATTGLGCFHIPDLFHTSHEITKTFGLYFKRKIKTAKQKLTSLTLSVSLATNIHEFSEKLDEIIMLPEQEYSHILSEQQEYHKQLHRLSQTIHPFNVDNSKQQSSSDVQAILRDIEQKLRYLAEKHQINDDGINKFARQISDLSSLPDAWWEWVNQSLTNEDLDSDMKSWLLECLLPYVYWSQQIDKTTSKPLKEVYQKALAFATEKFKNHLRTKILYEDVILHWHSWAEWIVSQFQRGSSPVEGRNGFLSQVHHGSRGLTREQLKVLKIIHNYDTRRADGSTPAGRFFGREFPDLFEWIMERIDDLPMPRKKGSSSKNKLAKVNKSPPNDS